MVTRDKMQQHKPQMDTKHPERWQSDLNPAHEAAKPMREASIEATPELRHASDIKELTRRLQGFTIDELREIPIVPIGEALRPGSVYVDLHAPERRPFVATEGMRAGEYNWFAPKAEVPRPYWNRLVDAEPEERRF